MQTGKLRLYKEEYPPVHDEFEVMAEGELTSTRLGIYTVDVVIDGRGPIKMLVDSGATSSFLSWQGATDLVLVSLCCSHLAVESVLWGPTILQWN